MIQPTGKPINRTFVLSRRAAACLAIACLGAGAALLTACQEPRVEVLIDDLTAPRGLSHAPVHAPVHAGGGFLIAEGGAGRILHYAPAPGGVDALTEVATRLPVSLDAGPGGNTAAGVAAVESWPAYRTGALAFIVGEYRSGRFSRLYVLPPDGPPEGVTPESELLSGHGMVNPYDLAILDGDAIVSDAGANVLWRVTPEGEVSRYAEFPDLQLPGVDRAIDVVPTGMQLRPDGTLYVASLTGYPYPPGGANVYAVRDLDGDGDALDPGEVEVVATGFTAATDVAVIDGGFLVTEYSADMRTLVEEHGVDEAAAVPGRLVRWRSGEVEPLADLVSPTSLLLDGERALVSEEFPGRLVAVELD